MAQDTESTAWHEDDALWEDWAPFGFTDETLQRAEHEAEALTELLSLAPGAAVLDLGCGIGRHTLAFARRGHPAVGVDRTRSFLDRARRTAAEAGSELDAEFVEADMREFRRPDAFDAAFNMFTTFGYFETPEEDRRVVENLHASLRPGGRLVMEMIGKEALARRFQPRDWSESEGGAFCLEERRPEPGWTAMNNRWILIRDGRTREIRFRLRLYSAAELERLLRDAGFTDTQSFGGLDGEPYDQTANRLVVTATKPAA